MALTEQQPPKKNKRPPRGGAAPSSPRRIAARDKQGRALELKKAGLSYARIAQELGYRSTQGAEYAVKTALKELVPIEDAEEVRRMEAERLDAMFVPMYTKAIAGDRLAVDRCLAIMTRRAALLGLDAPIRIQQMVITEEQFNEAIAALEEEAAVLEVRASEVPDEPADTVDAELVEDEG